MSDQRFGKMNIGNDAFRPKNPNNISSNGGAGMIVHTGGSSSTEVMSNNPSKEGAALLGTLQSRDYTSYGAAQDQAAGGTASTRLEQPRVPPLVPLNDNAISASRKQTSTESFDNRFGGYKNNNHHDKETPIQNNRSTKDQQQQQQVIVDNEIMHMLDILSSNENTNKTNNSHHHNPSRQETKSLDGPESFHDYVFGGANHHHNNITKSPTSAITNSQVNNHNNNNARALPSGGVYYTARIFTISLHVMFFKPQDLTDSLFLSSDRRIIDALDNRPVVAYIMEGSSAPSAGIELGHVLLKVNGVEVHNPKEASKLISEGPRPLPLDFYIPDTTVVIAEGEYMVKYNSKLIDPPNKASEWKPKYVVVGGILEPSYFMSMYRSKSEYDIAVVQMQSRRGVDVKIKKFDLRQAKIINEWQGPQSIEYKNQLHSWKYIVIKPLSGNPIKISSPNLTQLKPVLEAIRRVVTPPPPVSTTVGGSRGGNNHYLSQISNNPSMISGNSQPPIAASFSRSNDMLASNH